MNKEQNTDLKKGTHIHLFTIALGFPCHAHCIASFWFSPDDLSYYILELYSK